MFYLLHGDDEFGSRELLKKLRQQGDFQYNQDTYSGAEVDLNTLIITSNTMPFLSEQRLVVLEGLPKRKRGEAAESAADGGATTEATTKGKGKRGKKGSKNAALSRAGFEKALAEHISTMAETTVFILIVDEVLDAANPLMKAAEKHGKIIQSTVPKGNALEAWITRRAKGNNV